MSSSIKLQISQVTNKTQAIVAICFVICDIYDFKMEPLINKHYIIKFMITYIQLKYQLFRWNKFSFYLLRAYHLKITFYKCLNILIKKKLYKIKMLICFCLKIFLLNILRKIFFLYYLCYSSLFIHIQHNAIIQLVIK